MYVTFFFILTLDMICTEISVCESFESFIEKNVLEYVCAHI